MKKHEKIPSRHRVSYKITIIPRHGSFLCLIIWLEAVSRLIKKSLAYHLFNIVCSTNQLFIFSSWL